MQLLAPIELGDFPQECRICEAALPSGRDDEICADCRAFRTVMKRDTRPKITPNPQAAAFNWAHG